MRFAIILFSLVFGASVGWGQIEPAESFESAKPRIVQDDSLHNIKRSVIVQLERPLSEAALERLAHTIRGRQDQQYERTFIEYYLPGMKVGAGAWATTHFDPHLKVTIWGFTAETQLDSQP